MAMSLNFENLQKIEDMFSLSLILSNSSKAEPNG